MSDRTIYLLIGPKGSGKTHIGMLMQTRFGVPFIRVEDWARAVRQGRAIEDEAYVEEVFRTIEEGIRKELKQHPRLVFESTGITRHFDRMLHNLQADHTVVTIKVLADAARCLDRVRTRDRSIHIDVSDDQVSRINELVAEKNMRCDHEIHNNDKPEEQLVTELQMIIG